MRDLVMSEMTFIAGGHDPSDPPKEIKLPTVVVSANRPRNSYDQNMFNLLMAHVNYEPPPDWDPNHEDKCFINNADPLLKAAPTGVKTGDIRSAALLIQDYVKGKNQGVEYAALIYADQSGNIRVGTISTLDSSTSAPYVNDIQSGERVVGLVHSHPDLGAADHSVPSTDATNGAGSQNDESTVNQAIANGLVDPQALIYIIDNRSSQMYEYDPKNISVSNRNNITNDLAQYGPSCGH